jgi:hypothetical protein
MAKIVDYSGAYVYNKSALLLQVMVALSSLSNGAVLWTFLGSAKRIMFMWSHVVSICLIGRTAHATCQCK